MVLDELNCLFGWSRSVRLVAWGVRWLVVAFLVFLVTVVVDRDWWCGAMQMNTCFSWFFQSYIERNAKNRKKYKFWELMWKSGYFEAGSIVLVLSCFLVRFFAFSSLLPFIFIFIYKIFLLLLYYFLNDCQKTGALIGDTKYICVFACMYVLVHMCVFKNIVASGIAGRSDGLIGADWAIISRFPKQKHLCDKQRTYKWCCVHNKTNVYACVHVLIVCVY